MKLLKHPFVLVLWLVTLVDSFVQYCLLQMDRNVSCRRARRRRLTGLRQARWYGSGGLGLGVAILVSVTVANVSDFWRAIFLILLGGAIVATARFGRLYEQRLLRWPAAVGAAGTGYFPNVGRFYRGYVCDGLAWVTDSEFVTGVFPLVALSNDQRWRNLQNDSTGRQTVTNHRTEWNAA